jgi:hypothetical protein
MIGGFGLKTARNAPSADLILQVDTSPNHLHKDETFPEVEHPHVRELVSRQSRAGPGKTPDKGWPEFH